MELIVVRHGRRADKSPSYDGGFNTPLSDQGHKQANRVGAYLGEQNIDAIYSSALLRALQTAEPVADATDAPWHVWPIFGEISNRTWLQRAEEDPSTAEVITSWQTNEEIEEPEPAELENRHGHYYLLSEISDRFPGTILDQPFPFPDAWWEAKGNLTRSTGLAQVSLGVQELIHRHAETEDRVAVVCHAHSGGGIISTLLEHAPRNRFRAYHLSNTGVTSLQRRGEHQWRLLYHNRVEHLEPDLRT